MLSVLIIAGYQFIPHLPKHLPCAGVKSLPTKGVFGATGKKCDSAEGGSLQALKVPQHKNTFVWDTQTCHHKFQKCSSVLIDH